MAKFRAFGKSLANLGLLVMPLALNLVLTEPIFDSNDGPELHIIYTHIYCDTNVLRSRRALNPHRWRGDCLVLPFRE